MFAITGSYIILVGLFPVEKSIDGAYLRLIVLIRFDLVVAVERFHL